MERLPTMSVWSPRRSAGLVRQELRDRGANGSAEVRLDHCVGLRRVILWRLRVAIVLPALACPRY